MRTTASVKIALRRTQPMNETPQKTAKPLIQSAPLATDGTPVRVMVKPGCVVIEPDTKPTLEEMLAAFNPKEHGGEVMADASCGVEAFA